MNLSRRAFVGAGAALFASSAFAEGWRAPEKNTVRGGFDEVAEAGDGAAPWTPYSDRRVRVGIAGEGVCSFGSAFSYQTHPNAEVVVCADVQPDRLKLLQERVKAPRAYKSCEKPVYQTLRNLIAREWRTAFRTQTDADGRIHFRGFSGDYEVCFMNAKGNALEVRRFCRKASKQKGQVPLID